ncbi:DUF4919 domain-containing protein [Seonamhaeicola aphaedonensis]|nr:DUF4919 domain-containing protein [Seonamhaeicola aphaedonensis]
MRKTILLLIMAFVSNLILGQNFEYQTDFKRLVVQSQDSLSDNYYEKLRAEFVKNGENFTKDKVIALMSGQTASKFYDAYGMIDMERAYQVADKYSSDTIHKYVHRLLEIHPVNLSMNYGLWKTYEKDGETTNAEKYKKRFNLICESILTTGNGTNEKPYFVISPIDGQVLIRLYYKKEIGMMGSGRDPNGNFVDILEMVDEKDSKSLNFVIDHAMGLFRQQMREVDEKEIEDKYEIDENGKVILKKKKGN